MSLDHSHSDDKGETRSLGKLKIALLVTFVYMFVEAVGGWYSNSLALIADAGHMLTDVGALGLTLLAIRFAARPATAKKLSVITVWRFSPPLSTASRSC